MILEISLFLYTYTIEIYNNNLYNPQHAYTMDQKLYINKYRKGQTIFTF